MRGGRGCSQPAGRCDVLCAFGGKLVVYSGHCIAQSFSASLPQPFRLLLGSWSPKKHSGSSPSMLPSRQLRLSRESKKRARPMIMMGLAWEEKPCRGARSEDCLVAEEGSELPIVFWDLAPRAHAHVRRTPVLREKRCRPHPGLVAHRREKRGPRWLPSILIVPSHTALDQALFLSFCEDREG